MSKPMKKTVIIYGGGIAGAQLAKQIARDAAVTLVDPLDYFEVPMAAPRNLVKPAYAEHAIIPFAQALPTVVHRRARLIELSEKDGLIEDSVGNQSRISADITVLATGSKFSNELMRADNGTFAVRKQFYGLFHQKLLGSKRVLIVGGGPIGVEVAGEISENFPEKSITLLDSGARLLRGTSEAAAEHAAAVLSGRGVKILLGQKIESGASAIGEVFAEAGEVLTSKGQRIPYDMILWCIGGTPNTAYMQSHYAHALNGAGRIQVTPDLRVKQTDNLFALGDITDLDENKMAYHTGKQVKIAAENVRALLAGNASGKTLKAYKPATGDPMMAVTLGSRTGVSHLPLFGVVRAAWVNRKLKAEHMLVPAFRKIFNAP
jgi:apoptosis-inducing factor 2